VDIVEGVAKFDNRLIVLLNTKKILPLDDMNLLEDTIVNVSDSQDGKNVEVTREVDTIGGKVTIKEVCNAKEFFNGKIDKNDPKYNIFELMITFMDALAVHNYEQMEAIVEQLVKVTDNDLFKEIGKITRKLHDSLEEFKGAVNNGLQRITENEVQMLLITFNLLSIKQKRLQTKQWALWKDTLRNRMILQNMLEKLKDMKNQLIISGRLRTHWIMI